jgi:hypothetical protein
MSHGAPLLQLEVGIATHCFAYIPILVSMEVIGQEDWYQEKTGIKSRSLSATDRLRPSDLGLILVASRTSDWVRRSANCG